MQRLPAPLKEEIMDIRKLPRSMLFLAAIGAFGSGAAHAGGTVKWKMQSLFGSKLDVVGEAAVLFTDNLETISQGTLKVKFYEPGALVPPLEIFKAVSMGSIESGYTTAGAHTGTIPAAAFFTSVPFGPDAGEFLAWLDYGGGHAIKDEVYGKHGVRGITCSIVPPEASGWFRNEIKTVGDLKGLKIRFFGLGARVIQKLGASTQLLAPGDVYPALERGVVDAAELSFPSIDYRLGFHKVAKHYYFPGWHNQSAVGEFLVNLKAYEKLSPAHRKTIDVACDANIKWSFTAGEARQFEAIEKIRSEGVTIHFWPEPILQEMRKAWDQVVAEESAKDPLFKRTYDSYAAFRSKYEIWKNHGYLR
jgi:TRAP-type mannitol/chloroaromatic compound transport system substrate-binding protein